MWKISEKAECSDLLWTLVFSDKTRTRKHCLCPFLLFFWTIVLVFYQDPAMLGQGIFLTTLSRQHVEVFKLTYKACAICWNIKYSIIRYVSEGMPHGPHHLHPCNKVHVEESVVCIGNISKTIQTSANKIGDTHLNKTACDIWSIFDKVYTKLRCAIFPPSLTLISAQSILKSWCYLKVNASLKNIFFQPKERK